MNRVVLHMMLSLDGYFEGPDGSLAWHQVDEDLHQQFNDMLRGAGAFVSGRRNYELMEGYWPKADERPDASPAEVDFAKIWRRVPKVVYSTTLTSVGENATLLTSLDPDGFLAIKGRADGDLVVGGAELGRSFLALGLIDELRIFVNPVVISAGRRIFDETVAPMSLELLDVRPFANGVVMLHYAVN